MVLLIWATVYFAASVLTYSWFGVNENVLSAQGSDPSFSLKDARFDAVVGWVASGTMMLLVSVVLTSFFYFWRVSSKPGLDPFLRSFQMLFISGLETFELPFYHQT